MKKVAAKKPRASTKQVAKASATNRKEMQAIVDMINKKYGDNAISLGVPSTEAYSVEYIPTGSITLDIALGGGIPRGRYTQIAGKESSSKTTQSIHIIRNAQNMGLTCAFIDVEGTSDEAYFRALGVDYDSLLYSRPDGTEEAFDIVLALQKTGQVDLAVVDSIAALAPNKEMDKQSLDDSLQMGIQPKLLGEFFRKYQANNNRLNREGKVGFTLICINQIREKIGGYGNPEYTPGGNAKNFAMSIDLRLSRGDWITEGSGENKEVVGQVVKFNVLKNKLYKRAQTGEFDFYTSDDNNAGVENLYVDRVKEIIALAVGFDLIEKKGAWFMYNGESYQGLKSVVELFREDEDEFESLREKVMQLAVRK